MRTDVSEIDRDLSAALKTLREALRPVDGSPEDHAMCSVETFAVIALRVMSKTNPSKLRSETRTVEIKARMDGIQVLS